MLIKEYRIMMPLSVDEYQTGHLYSIAEASMNETGGGEGIEVVRNEPFQDVPLLGGRNMSGQYTYKKYHLASKVPIFIRLLTPKGSMEIHEEAWNAYPYTKTVITNPGYMSDNFMIVIESLHLPDRGTKYNVHDLTPEQLKLREVIRIDIANDPVSQADYKLSHDPTKFHSEKCDRGPLTDKWWKEVQPVMTCYKLVTVDFKWFGIQSRAENFIQRSERRIFLNFHRQMFCWLDEWYGLTMEEIRELEKNVIVELNKQRNKGSVRGTKGIEDE